MKKILYLEDDPINAYVIKKQVGDHALLRVFTHPDEALERLKLTDEVYDLLLIDIHLGEGVMDGREFCQQIRQFPAYKNITCVAVTAFAMPGDKQELLSLGFDKYISKPIVREELLSILSDESTEI